jgi:UDP-galactopyranose mutase
MLDIGREITNATLVVVGAGFFGSVIARKAAEDLNVNVLVIDRRTHIGGNAYSYFDDETGIEVHQYGTHIFHTSNETVWTFINRFTEFTDYRHAVFSKHDGQLFQMPINLHTISQFFSGTFSPQEARDLIEQQASANTSSHHSNLEDKAIAMIGEPLYRAFIKGYTEKQWGTDPKFLPAETITRLPVRFNLNGRYFNDTYEGLPKLGYSAIFDALLDHPKIKVVLNTDYFAIRNDIPTDKVILFTGPLDKFYDYKHGELGWRTIDLTFEKVQLEDFQGAAVVNEADLSTPHTRTHEYKHLRPDDKSFFSPKTIVSREFSRFADRSDEPYYPINAPEDRAKLALYRELSKNEDNVYFGGRLGTYQYLDMHMAIASALVKFENELRPRLAAAIDAR